MTEKLLPCPFCGGKASTMAYLGKWITGCCDCLAGTRDDYETRARAITAWNRRSPPPAVEGGCADWPFDATLCAKEVLESLGIGSDESLEPGDRRRDRIARIIGKYLDEGRAPTPPGEKP